MSINDRTERLSKLDEVMQKLKIIYKQGLAQDGKTTQVCLTLKPLSLYLRFRFGWDRASLFNGSLVLSRYSGT